MVEAGKGPGKRVGDPGGKLPVCRLNMCEKLPVRAGSGICAGLGAGQVEVLGMHDHAIGADQKQAIGARFVHRQVGALIAQDQGHLVAGAFEDGIGNAARRALHRAVDMARDDLCDRPVAVQRVDQRVAVAQTDPVHPAESGAEGRVMGEHHGCAAFGPGLHHCIGHILARAELSQFMARAFARFDIEILQDEFEMVPSYIFYGYRSLKVRFTPR